MNFIVCRTLGSVEKDIYSEKNRCLVRASIQKMILIVVSMLF